MGEGFVFLIFFASLVSGQYTGCDYYQDMFVGIEYNIGLMDYERNFSSSSSCRWAAEAPPGYQVDINCHISLPWSPFCSDRLKISKTGRTDVEDGVALCGAGSYQLLSDSTKLTVSLYTKIVRGKFNCTVKAVPNDCVCGQKNPGRIVGGFTAGVNEYPMMAGLAEVSDGKIYCGSTIISNTAALTAGHCLDGKSRQNIDLIVGEHDTSVKVETDSTAVYKLKDFVIHPEFNSETLRNDIGLVFTETSIEFNRGVGQSCLPLKFRGEMLTGEKVTGAGWGTLDYGGKRPDQLQKVELTIVEKNASCSVQQMCTLAKDRDTCQYDSGGPLFFQDDNLLYNVAVISFGVACATDNPSVNTRVSEYMDFIMQNTRQTVYCVK